MARMARVCTDLLTATEAVPAGSMAPGRTTYSLCKEGEQQQNEEGLGPW
jgi:hypothetical protein